MPRGNYAKITAKDRERLVNAYSSGRDWQRVADILGIKRQSARNVIRIYVRDGRTHSLPKGGNRRRSLSEDMLTKVVQFIEEKPTATLEEMRVHLQTHNPTAAVSLSTISRSLDGQMITLKTIRNVPANWNCDNVKIERKMYMEWLLERGIGQNLIFMDEFGVNLWTSRSQGRAASGSRAVRIVDGQRGANLTICLAVSPQWGLVHWMMVTGGFCNDSFCNFISELEALVDVPFTVLCDNARPHCNAPALAHNHELAYLPRYSPFLNCTEMAGSALKSAAKRRLSEPAIQAELREDDGLFQTLHHRRLHILRREMERALECITQAKCSNWFQHCLTYAPRCLSGEDIVA
jgi:transposase